MRLHGKQEESGRRGFGFRKAAWESSEAVKRGQGLGIMSRVGGGRR